MISKEKIIITIIIIVLFAAGYIIISQKNSKLTSPPTIDQPAPFNTDDNLDEALEELEQLNQL